MKKRLLPTLGLVIAFVLAFASPSLAEPRERPATAWMDSVVQWLLPWTASSESCSDLPRNSDLPLPDSPSSDLTTTSNPQDNPPEGEATPLVDPDG